MEDHFAHAEKLAIAFFFGCVASSRIGSLALVQDYFHNRLFMNHAREKLPELKIGVR